MMKHFFYFLPLMLLTWNVSAQTEPKSEFAKDFLPVWNTSTNIAIQVAEAMPENLYDFKPNDSSMTFRQQLIHLGYTSYFLMDYFTQDSEFDYDEPDMSDKCKAEIVAYLKGNFKKASELFCSLSDAQMKEEVKAFNGEMLKRYMTIYFVQDHLTNHRAKANLYIRINNIKPPEYGFF